MVTCRRPGVDTPRNETEILYRLRDGSLRMEVEICRNGRPIISTDDFELTAVRLWEEGCLTHTTDVSMDSPFRWQITDKGLARLQQKPRSR